MSDKNIVTAIRLSKENVEFARKNPKVAENVGLAITMINEYQQRIEVCKFALDTPAVFENLQESGTKEDLVEFMREMKTTIGTSKLQTASDLSESEIDKVSEAVKSRNGFHLEVDCRNKTEN